MRALLTFAARKPLWQALDENAIQNFKTGEQVLMGHRLAQTLGVQAGDTITLVGARGRTTPFGTLPQRRSYKVAGLFDVGMFEYDKAFIFMPLKAAQSFFGSDDRVTALEVYASNLNVTDQMRQNIMQTVPASVRVNDWRDRNRSFLNALAVERNVMFLILTLIILVAAFNIISSMIMLVRSKNNDIAVLRAMGATGGGVMRVFFMTGAFNWSCWHCAWNIARPGVCWNIDGIKSLIEGLTGSELFAAEIYFLSTLPAEVNPQEVFMVILMALGLSFGVCLSGMAGIAYRAAEALRYE